MEKQLPPAQALTDLIIKSLIDEGLTKEDENFKQLLIDGKVKDSDWELAFKKALDTKE